MDQDNAINRFQQLKEQYDEQHGHGASLDVKDEFGLGRGQFNDQLTMEELEKLNAELADRLAALDTS